MTMVSPYRTSPYQQAVYKNPSPEHLEILGQRPRSWLGRFVDRLRGAKRVKEEREEAAAELLRSGKLAGYDLSGINWRLVPGDVTDQERSPLIGAKLEGCKFRNMPGVVMKWSDLTGANLEGAILTGADLRIADLGCANLEGAKLEGANLWHADLTGANLEGAILTGADLWSADLTGAILTGAYLGAADLRGARGLETACFENARTAGAKFSPGFEPSSITAPAAAVVPAPAQGLPSAPAPASARAPAAPPSQGSSGTPGQSQLP